MFEIESRGGLGRRGVWARDGRSLPTPLILFVHQPEQPAPGFAEALFVSERTDDPRFQIQTGGSVFAPRPPKHPDDLPPTKGLPQSLADLEMPEATAAGDLAIVVGEKDLAPAARSEAVFVANGPEFERSPREFVATVRRVRETLGPGKVIAVTGLATPSNLSVLVYAGIDVMDSSRMRLDSARARFHTADGSVPLAEADRDACGCPACASRADLAAHNDFALHRETLLVRNHLAHGRLRELVERRIANAPWNTVVVRHLDLRAYDLVEPYTSVRGGPMLAYSHASLHRPEIVRFRHRIRERYRKPPSARVLLLLPCSARKPYSMSRSHRRFRDAILAAPNPSVVHEVIVTSPLGLIPRELERFHPARDYDIPVTGDWSRDEAAIVEEDLSAFLAANAFDAVVAHLDAEAPFVREVLPDVLVTAKDRPTSDESIASLARTLAEVTKPFERIPKGIRFAEEMANVATFQFGHAGRRLIEGAAFRGRFPNVRVIQAGTQVAMYTEGGMLSLTLAGGERLSKEDAYWVEIEDFHPVGNVFAVGVEDAAPEIRPGDEVVARHDGDVRAVGTARLAPREMRDLRRGEAVHVRHVRPKAP
jgi:archaeosine synthase alpha-subunit